MVNYVDSYGRWHIKPVTNEDPLPTNNAYIYSFYASMVGLSVNLTREVGDQLADIRVTVLTRHPGDNNPPISHDEYVGAAGLHPQYARDICIYGESHYWQFCDIPGFTPTPFRKLVLDDVLSAYEDLANEDHPRLAVIKYPALWPIAFWHRPEQQYFYYRCAGRSPGAFRTLYFVLATLVSIFQKDKTSPMLGFKFLKFKQLGLTFIEKGLLDLFDRNVNWKEICRNYFPKDHPILERARYISLGTNYPWTGGGL